MINSLMNNYFLFRFIQKIKLIFFGCINIFFTTLFLIPAFFLRIIKFFIHIRIGCIRNDVIGNAMFNIDYYLCEKKRQKIKTIDIFYFRENYIINKQLIKMFKDKLVIFFLFKYLAHASNLIFNSSDFKVNFGDGRDLTGSLYFSGKNFNFDNKENERGINFLKHIGFDIDIDKFICLTVRDEKYKKQFSSNKFTDPKYWNYQNFRNAKIENYYHVAQELLDRNYWVIRMGKITSREMIIKNDKFLDYSFSSYRDDFLDMWLMANCFFSISNSTGIDEVAKAFRKPIVNTDFALYGLPNLNLYSLTCFKKMVYKENKELISLNEIIKNNFISFDRTEHFEEKGIEFIDNSPEEITETVLEMEKDLNNELNEGQKALDLNQNFLKIYKKWKNYHKFHGFIHPKARISGSFLRHNNDWFFN